jgi:2-polyprenyl-3-methyl-5-hydroxy-6-metoxy-1,4-benzoquinol methylase
VDARGYQRCNTCEATFLDPTHFLSAEQERAEYAQHQNLPGEAGYVRFLKRAADPLLARLAPGSQGLDYGCGPGPVLAQLLRSAGHAVALYDPFFHPDAAALQTTYDFVTCTEVIEHFHAPALEFRRLDGLLKPGGWLALMTCFQTDDARFAQWHYRRDPTHVVFYREATLAHIARRHGWQMSVPQRNVALMHKALVGA